ncbi:Crp/Fnr family transcriptional regulator [soil metagenome]
MNLYGNDSVFATDKKMLLRNHDIFTKLNDLEHEEVHLLHSVIEAKKGDYIYFESQYLNKIFFIKSGYIKIGYIDNNGNEIIKEILQAGEIFGQCALEQNSMNGEFALAYKNNVSLCAFTIDNFRKVLEKNNSVAIRYSQKVGNRLRRMENRLMNMLYADVKTRLLRFFNDIIQANYAAVSGNSIVLDNFLTHKDIALLIGSTRQTVTSVFNEQDIKQLVRISKTHIVIPDIKAVKRMSAY